MAKSRNRRKNGKVAKSYIGNSKGFREVKNDPTISDSQFKSNQDAVKKCISVMNRFFNSNENILSDVPYLNGIVINSIGTKLDNSVMKNILCRIASSKLALSQDEIDQTGTAMFPIDCGYWVIGSFGSIWLDVEIEGIMYRVCFYNENPYPTINVEPLTDDFSSAEIERLIKQLA